MLMIFLEGFIHLGPSSQFGILMIILGGAYL